MKVLHEECIEDKDGVSFSSQFFFQIIFYSDKYLAVLHSIAKYLTILHTNCVLHVHNNKCLPSEKRVRYFCPLLTKSNHYTSAAL
jgi:hypothetical protein